jgi:protein SYS1
MARKRPNRPPININIYSPRRLFTQIVIIQSLYYLSSFILTFFTSTLSGHPFTLDWIWDWRGVRVDNVLGWTVGLLWVLNGIIA